jgi:hypothetical protein
MSDTAPPAVARLSRRHLTFAAAVLGIVAGLVAGLGLPTWVGLRSFTPSVSSADQVVAVIWAVCAGASVAVLIVGLGTLAGTRAGKSEPPSDGAVAAQQRASVLITVAVVISTVGLLASYLYLRVATIPYGWVTLTGFNFGTAPRYYVGAELSLASLVLHTPIADLTVTEGPVVTGLAWARVGAFVLLALLTWVGLSRMGRPRARGSKFVPFALVAIVLAAVEIGMIVNQIRNIPQLFIVRNPIEFAAKVYNNGKWTGGYRDYVRYQPGNTEFIHAGFGASMIALDVVFIGATLVLVALAARTIMAARSGALSSANRLSATVLVGAAGAVTAAAFVTTAVTQFWH